MSRRELAEAAGVSDRYLTQLESGRGNVSILLLRRLARALDVPVERLLEKTEI
jgi:XRE family aerobic/anaerobic benzoate catabolism transcriptional regulator